MFYRVVPRTLNMNLAVVRLTINSKQRYGSSSMNRSKDSLVMMKQSSIFWCLNLENCSVFQTIDVLIHIKYFLPTKPSGRKVFREYVLCHKPVTKSIFIECTTKVKGQIVEYVRYLTFPRDKMAQV